MSSVNTNFGSESLIMAMSKRQSESQGQMSLQLLEGAVQNVAQSSAQGAQATQQAAQAASLATEGSVGTKVNTYA